MTYDAAGLIVERADASDRTTRWAYDASGRVSSFGAAGAEPITVRRDVLGRAVAVDEPGAPVNGLRWDAADRLLERRRGELAMRWRYTDDGKRAAMTYPDGTETTYSYDAGGLMVAKEHPALGPIALERDAAGRLVGATADGMRAAWHYEHGDLVAYEFETAATHRTARLTRDTAGRVVAATVDGRAQRYSYDPAGQLRSAETPDGRLSLALDANGRLVRETSPAGTSHYEHDLAGQLRARRGPSSELTEYEYDGAGRRVRETAAGRERTWSWDDLGRLAHIGSSPPERGHERGTSVTVDALDELADVDGAPLMWDGAGALSPLTWLDGQAVVGHGSPWALAGAGAAEWLAPDWQGTVGDAPRDPLGAVFGEASHDLELGYRGEIELGGDTWLRNRVFQAASRSFLQPDPIAPVSGAAWAANPYHYAANDPIGYSDPLGLRPITEAELQQVRDGMGGSPLLDFLGDVGDTVVDGLTVVKDVAVRIATDPAPFSTALGLIIGGVGMKTGQVKNVKYQDGVVVFEWNPNSSWRGLTLGTTVNLFGGNTEDEGYKHELAHVRDFRVLHDSFIPLYIAGGIYGLATSPWKVVNVGGRPIPVPEHPSCFFGVNKDRTYGNPLEREAERMHPSDNCP